MNKTAKEKINIPNELKKMNLIPYFGFTVFANMAVAGLMGYYLDKWTFNNKILFILFLFFGMISGIYNGIKEILKESRLYEEKKKTEDNQEH
ncbi:MAG TPA: AtpZ/AtpI family protein [Thermotogota bacterium]|nr:AtpZ/AtpI family protein [Thermotogota bacterium]HPJ89131.1 AtpZ/AtpI family protein [Thermotogota bacterium]HPR96763.1 AtpZ/AtpI family protein [Thermotogota bacterium]